MAGMTTELIRSAEPFRRLPMLLSGVTVMVVTVIVFFAQTIVPERIHLSVVAETTNASTFEVTKVMPAGAGYDAGLKGGEIIVGYEGGRVTKRNGHLTLSNPSQVDVMVMPEATVRRISAENEYWMNAHTAPLLMGVVALTFVLAGAALLYLRVWDQAVRSAFTLFFSVSIAISLGIFSGFWGGEFVVFLEIIAVLLFGSSLVFLFRDMPRQPLQHRNWAEWRWRAIIGVAVVTLGVGALSLFYQPELYRLTRTGIGLYLLLCLGAAIWDAIQAYRHSDSQVQRLQYRIMGISALLGVGTLILLLVLPMMLFSRAEFVPFEVNIAMMAVVPVGWSYAFVHPGLQGDRYWVQRLLAPATGAVASFVIAASITTLAQGILFPQPLRPTLWPIVVGLLSATITIVSLAAAGVFRRFLEMGDTRRFLVPKTREEVGPSNLEENARVDERLRLLSQLHDGPVQTATRLALIVGSESSLSPDIKEQTEQLVKELRQIIRFGSISQVSAEDWLPTLRSLAAEIENTTGIAVSVLPRKTTPRMVTPDIATTLFHVARESLYNVVRHSKATECVVSIRVAGPTIRLSVRDNGVGFNPRRPEGVLRGTFGLRSMRTRVERLGGKFEINSAPSAGTTIAVSIPLGYGNSETQASVAG